MYRQRHLLGYRSRFRTLNRNPNPKTHPNPNPIFKLTLTNPNLFFERKQKRHRNIGQHRVFIYTKGRGGFMRGP